MLPVPYVSLSPPAEGRPEGLKAYRWDRPGCGVGGEFSDPTCSLRDEYVRCYGVTSLPEVDDNWFIRINENPVAASRVEGVACSCGSVDLLCAVPVPCGVNYGGDDRHHTVGSRADEIPSGIEGDCAVCSDTRDFGGLALCNTADPVAVFRGEWTCRV